MRRLAVAAVAVVLLGVVTGGSAPVSARALHVFGPTTGGLPSTCSTPARWRLMFTGDSMTQGVGYTPYWARLLPRMWAVQTQSVGSQSNAWGTHEGISGQTASQLYARIDGLLDTYTPDVVVLDIGTNLDGTAANTWQWIYRVADKVLDRPCTRLLLAQMSYVYDSPKSVAQRYANQRIPDFVQSRDGTGTRARWVNFSHMTYGMTADKAHWNERGADVASVIVFDQLTHLIDGMPASAIDLPFMPENTGGPDN